MKLFVYRNTDPKGIYRLSFLQIFKININFVYDKWCKWHFFGSSALVLFFMLLTGSLLSSIICSFLCGLAWDIGDGFKKLWNQSKSKNRWINELFYSDGFSWSDVFIFDLCGVMFGAGVINSFLQLFLHS